MTRILVLAVVASMGWATQGQSQAPLFSPAPGSPVTVGPGSGNIITADLNGDGHLDLVTGHIQSRIVTIQLGDGAGEPVSEEVSAREALARGVELVHGELRRALERAGVETYDPTGERFDPAQHEALAVRSGADGVEAGTVIETLEKGYRVDGQVLRAARVVVSE